MKRSQWLMVTACASCFGALAILAQQGCAAAPESEKNQAEAVAAVRTVLETQQTAWNRGDIDAFMDGYERADTTSFVSGDTVTHGWQTVLDRYRKNYSSRDKMGTLAFSELEIKPLSAFYAVAVGRWQLTRAGDTPHGRFTLVFRRTAAGWRIVQDTTTSAS